MKPKVLVVSHERAGTHFLINSIAFNFGYDNRQIDVPEGELDIKWFEQWFGREENRIFKSHHQAEFYVDIIDELIKGGFKIFYMYRDGRDTLTSCWSYFNKAPVEVFPHCKTVGELIRTDPRKWPFDRAYSKVGLPNMVRRWAWHVGSWQRLRSKCSYGSTCLVCYEELYSDFGKTIDIVEVFLGVDRVSAEYRKPTLQDRCVAPDPRYVGIDVWEGVWEQEDLDFFFEQKEETYRRVRLAWSALLAKEGS